MASPAAPGLFFCFAAMVLLIFVSVSAPTWDKISFLNVIFNGLSIHCGVFGYTGSQIHFGYLFPLILNRANVNTDIIYNTTKALILHPIAAGLSCLAVLFGLCGAGGSRAGTVFMSLTSVLAFLATLVAWVIDMALFGIARKRILDAGGLAQYGNATWMTLGALVSLALGFCFGFFGTFGRYQRSRKF